MGQAVCSVEQSGLEPHVNACVQQHAEPVDGRASLQDCVDLLNGMVFARASQSLWLYNRLQCHE
jgi:hypothetical protein